MVVYKTVALANWAKAATVKVKPFIIYKTIIVKLLKSFNFDTLIQQTASVLSISLLNMCLCALQIK